MNEAQVRTIEQMREVLSGTQALQFTVSAEDAGRYGWIEGVLRRIRYRTLPRGSRGIVLAYLQRFSGYRRAYVNVATTSHLGQYGITLTNVTPGSVLRVVCANAEYNGSCTQGMGR